MTWNSYYQASDKTLWQGRTDLPPDSCFFQIVQCCDLQKHELTPAPKASTRFALVGFCCDTGIERNQGRLGADEGPDAIRQALAKLPLHKNHFELWDMGNITCHDGNLEAAQTALSDVVAMLLKNNFTPILLGGGHEVAWGHFQGIAKAFPKKNISTLNFDAHFDMRDMLKENKGSSGTPFLQIAEWHKAQQRKFDYNCVGIQRTGNIQTLFDTAKKFNTNILFADELHLGHTGAAFDFVDRIMDQNEMIYLSLCMDVFASAFAPGVSAAQPLGLFPWHVIPLIRELAASGKVISYDIAELSPPHDIGNTTAKLAASLIYEFIHHHNEQPRDWQNDHTKT